MKLRLTRFQQQGQEHTEGVLTLDGLRLPTIEQEWRDNAKGNSCVPVGTYKLLPFTRPSGAKVWALLNPTLGVYLYEDDIPEYAKPARSLILIHIGNVVDDCIGCILPGIDVGVVEGKRAVVNSGAAMKKLMNLLGHEDEHELEIVEWVE